MAKSADAFRTISEVAEWLETPAHVLRFWESRFTQVKPVKRAGGRRYYRPNDMLLLGGIKKLLHEDGMTIKGAQKLLSSDGIKKISALSQPLDREDQDAVEQEPSEATVEPTDQPTALSIITSDEAETETEVVLDAKPAATPDPAPDIPLGVTPDPAPAVAHDPEPVGAPEPEPETTVAAEPEPEPDAAQVSEPETSPISDPAPLAAAELDPVLPEVDDSPTVPATEPTETVEAPKPNEAAQSSSAETPNADVGDQLSSIYSRLTALHDRMKTDIDPKRQG